MDVIATAVSLIESVQALYGVIEKVKSLESEYGDVMVTLLILEEKLHLVKTRSSRLPDRIGPAIDSVSKAVEHARAKIEKSQQQNETKMAKWHKFRRALRNDPERVNDELNRVCERVHHLMEIKQTYDNNARYDASTILSDMDDKGDALRFWEDNFGSDHMVAPTTVFLQALERESKQRLRTAERGVLETILDPDGDKTVSAIEFGRWISHFGPIDTAVASTLNSLCNPLTCQVYEWFYQDAFDETTEHFARGQPGRANVRYSNESETTFVFTVSTLDLSVVFRLDVVRQNGQFVLNMAQNPSVTDEQSVALNRLLTGIGVSMSEGKTTEGSLAKYESLLFVLHNIESVVASMGGGPPPPPSVTGDSRANASDPLRANASDPPPLKTSNYNNSPNNADSSMDQYDHSSSDDNVLLLRHSPNVMHTNTTQPSSRFTTGFGSPTPRANGWKWGDNEFHKSISQQRSSTLETPMTTTNAAAIPSSVPADIEKHMLRRVQSMAHGGKSNSKKSMSMPAEGILSCNTSPNHSLRARSMGSNGSDDANPSNHHRKKRHKSMSSASAASPALHAITTPTSLHTHHQHKQQQQQQHTTPPPLQFEIPPASDEHHKLGRIKLIDEEQRELKKPKQKHQQHRRKSSSAGAKETSSDNESKHSDTPPSTHSASMKPPRRKSNAWIDEPSPVMSTSAIQDIAMRDMTEVNSRERMASFMSSAEGGGMQSRRRRLMSLRQMTGGSRFFQLGVVSSSPSAMVSTPALPTVPSSSSNESGTVSGNSGSSSKHTKHPRHVEDDESPHLQQVRPRKKRPTLDMERVRETSELSNDDKNDNDDDGSSLLQRNKPMFLVVSQDIVVVEHIQQVIRENGGNVEYTESPTDASSTLRKIHKHNRQQENRKTPHACKTMIVDSAIGREHTRMLKSHKYRPPTIIILTSKQKNPSSSSRALSSSDRSSSFSSNDSADRENGGTTILYLSKPVTSTTLMQAIMSSFQ